MALVAEQGQRDNIIQTVMDFMEQHPSLDGVEWDWRYPGQESSSGSSGYTAGDAAANRANYVELVVGLGAALHAKVGGWVHGLARSRL